MDWAFLHFTDDFKDDNTVNIGMLLGFIRFDTPGFPTPMHVESRSNGNILSGRDETLYAVVRCCKEYLNFDRKFVTEFQLIRGPESVYILPVKNLVGPAAVVPNIFNDFRMTDESETWLAILPYRKWGRIFGNSIKWQA